MKSVLLTTIIYCMSTSLIAQQVLPLYQHVPNSIPVANREHIDTAKDGIVRISKVTEPQLLVFLPMQHRKPVSAVVICPGGGYGILAASHEGTDVAKVFNEWGIAAFVLKYRLPDDSSMLDKEIGPLQDAQRAIQMVRENAREWGVNPAAIGIMGFSAGGHLASTAGTHFNKAVIDNPKGTSLRPDFMVLLYPVISFTDSLTHMGSRNNLLGKTPSPEKIKLYSNEQQVGPTTPPTFLVHAKDDGAVKVGNSLGFYEALQKNGVPAEIHLYEKGGHGFGMINKTSDVRWMDWLKQWMVGRKLL
ncbi:MAG: alpha/beta hydrolase [Bacteroidota bacterium]|nr:alpha/beta hydrolase [Bacteroidota bacterium]